MPSDEIPRRNRRLETCLAAFVVGIGLFVGFWAFVYQGYIEDAGMEPTQSWPIGVAAFGVAGVSVVWFAHRAKPSLGPGRLILLALGVAAVLVLAAIGSIDAGNP